MSLKAIYWIDFNTCRIAADEGRFKNNNEVIINTETRSVEVNYNNTHFLLNFNLHFLLDNPR